MRRLALTGLLLVGVASLARADDEERPHQDTARLAVRYTVLERDEAEDGRIREAKTEEPMIIVTTRYFVPFEAIQVRVDETGEVVPDLKLFKKGGRTKDIDGVETATWFMVEGELEAGVDYTVHIAYDEQGAWDRKLNAQSGLFDFEPVEDPEPATVPVEALETGKRVTNKGYLVDAGAMGAPTDHEGIASGFASKFPNTTLRFTPEIGEESDQFGLNYGLGYQVDRKQVSDKTRFTVDLQLDGRFTSDSDDPALAGFSKGDINVRLMKMWTPTDSERYHPVGLRGALGYEGDEQFDDTNFTATAQAVASVPYIDDALLWWHDVMDINRAFAPPFVAVGYVHSDGGGSSVPEQSRLELEAGWIAPIAENWDFDFRWSYFDFTESGVDSEDLFQAGFTYFTNGDRTQALKFTIEEGFRPVVGDIGETLIFGYLFQPM